VLSQDFLSSLSDPIWIGDVGAEAKNGFFYQFGSDFDGFWFFLSHAKCLVKKFYFKTRPKLKVTS
jgi:hypothetical protein